MGQALHKEKDGHVVIFKRPLPEIKRGLVHVVSAIALEAGSPRIVPTEWPELSLSAARTEHEDLVRLPVASR